MSFAAQFSVWVWPIKTFYGYWTKFYGGIQHLSLGVFQAKHQSVELPQLLDGHLSPLAVQPQGLHAVSRWRYVEGHHYAVDAGAAIDGPSEGGGSRNALYSVSGSQGVVKVNSSQWGGVGLVDANPTLTLGCKKRCVVVMQSKAFAYLSGRACSVIDLQG